VYWYGWAAVFADCEVSININLIYTFKSDSLILKMEAAGFSETLIRSYASHTRRP
jgi:mRNA-degrading endonuclease YafQ of YafQ-DinJ toxin-antitoxin module